MAVVYICSAVISCNIAVNCVLLPVTVNFCVFLCIAAHEMVRGKFLNILSRPGQKKAP